MTVLSHLVRVSNQDLCDPQLDNVRLHDSLDLLGSDRSLYTHHSLWD